jgi:hypothetical protein
MKSTAYLSSCFTNSVWTPFFPSPLCFSLSSLKASMIYNSISLGKHWYQWSTLSKHKEASSKRLLLAQSYKTCLCRSWMKFVLPGSQCSALSRQWVGKCAPAPLPDLCPAWGLAAKPTLAASHSEPALLRCLPEFQFTHTRSPDGFKICQNTSSVRRDICSSSARPVPQPWNLFQPPVLVRAL